jgi:hypothetical protein
MCVVLYGWWLSVCSHASLSGPHHTSPASNHSPSHRSPRSLKKATPYLCGDSLTIADLCAWPWFGNIVLGRLYGGSDTFLQVGEYTFVKAWADRVHARKGVQRGRCVNRPWGGAHEKLPNRHSASDFDSLPAPPEQKSE